MRGTNSVCPYLKILGHVAFQPIERDGDWNTFRNDNYLTIFRREDWSSRDAILMKSFPLLIYVTLSDERKSLDLVGISKRLVNLWGNKFRRSTLLVQLSQRLSAEFCIMF